MITEFEPLVHEIPALICQWESRFLDLPDQVITKRRNTQNRTIKQIVGHMIDSASNNTHRIVHLQYQKSPLVFPNYATEGNNDRWIAIQNYQEENWADEVSLWKYSHIHLIHVIKNIDPEKLNNEWISGPDHGNVSLKNMVVDFLRHFKLHLGEIEELMNKGD